MAESTKWWTLVLASVGAFMTALDTLIVATALPVLRVDLGATVTDLEWTLNSYNLAFACLLLTGAALGDRFGRRRMFVVGLVGFTAASVAAALAPTVGALVAARALQGAGAAIVMPLSLTLISEAFPGETRGMAVGIWSGITGLAVAAGPVVGGAVIDGIDWRWIFWLNVPIGLVLVPMVMARLRESVGPRSRLDVTGLVLAGAGFFGLTWGLVRANISGWGSLEVAGALLAGAALIAAFLAWERRAPAPMLPLNLFRRPAFASANAVAFFMLASLFGALFLISQLLQTSLGNSPLEAGLRILPWTGTLMVTAPIAGALADRFGNRPFMALGLALQAGGFAWIAAIADPRMGYGELTMAMIVAGVGTSMCLPTVANAAVGSVPEELVGVASGTNNSLRELGGVFGVAIVALVFADQGGYASPQAFVDGFTPALLVGAGLAGLGVVAALLAPGRARAQASSESPLEPSFQ